LVKEAVPDHEEEPETEEEIVAVKDPVMEAVKELEAVPDNERVMVLVEV